ncbi:hypothetical protein [Pseudovibrio denitrificans]|uniref:hypothetical protein n=1 Tax=Pseudovibrio denitrificans TaxID=258256 RepID=UPI0013E3233E|nr:hypothetical protein [Pseudovibrio denitrificans]
MVRAVQKIAETMATLSNKVVILISKLDCITLETAIPFAEVKLRYITIYYFERADNYYSHSLSAVSEE